MKSGFTRKDYIYIMLIFIAVFIFYWARQSFVSLPSLLFAEDGSIALSGIYGNGFADIFEPYFGYLHMYSKFVASITYLTDISYAPIIFLLASLIPLFLFIYVLYFFILSLNGSRLFTILLTLTVFLMPYGNEMILNVTYIKWYMYMLLVLYIIYDDAEKVLTPYVYYPTYIVFLFGGFISVFLAPLTVFKIFVDKYVLKTKIKKSSIFICCVTSFVAILQVIFMFNDTRFVDQVNNSMLVYLELLLDIFTLGANKYIYFYIFGVIFSSLIVFLIYKFICSYVGKNKIPKDRRFYLFIYIVFTVCVYVPSFYTLNLSSISITGLGSRYVFPVFILIAILIPVLTSNKKYLAILISSIFLLNIGYVVDSRLSKSDKFYSRDIIQIDYPFYEFVKFAKAERDVIIPTNPPYDNIWNLDIHNNERKIEPLVFDMDTQVNKNTGVTLNIYDLASTNCSDVKDIGIKFYITSSGPNKDNTVVRVILLNQFNKAKLPLKPYRFNDNLKYPIKVDGKQQVLPIDNDNKFMIYPVALNINEYNRLVVQTANTPINIDKLELFCLD